ncbi:unnamed protein product [Meloidogyne enterolobii]|uniref:Uncharacterized protein n=1 Tax=Meloidogyne enterolobii TaxID=390850 RepID=A0ACB1ASW8_MELEN
MGIPAIQLFLIFARQMAKPVSNRIMTYGRKHPFFRNKILIPAGRGFFEFFFEGNFEREILGGKNILIFF